MVAPRVSSDEEESDIIRHSLPKDTAAQEVIKNLNNCSLNWIKMSAIVCLLPLGVC